MTGSRDAEAHDGPMPRVTRKPLHAGTWYDDNAATLSASIDSWMADAQVQDGVHARAVIAPHAGYRYCGHVMAYAYKQINPAKVSRVFVLGPSHHVYSRKCVLSSAAEYLTPLGALEIDQAVYSELEASGEFGRMNTDVDEAEHSLELHMPYIVHALKGRSVPLVPIMVGALTPDSEARYGQLLSRYVDDPGNLFVVSSDFCHWGTRFNYTFHDKSQGAIHSSIEWLDRLGMDTIERQDPAEFTDYLRQYGNTICGRHPIGLFLNMLKHSNTQHSIKFTCYDQSSQCVNMRDSSVSYAAAIVVQE